MIASIALLKSIEDVEIEVHGPGEDVVYMYT